MSGRIRKLAGRAVLAVAGCLVATALTAVPARTEGNVVFMSANKNMTIKVAKGKPRTIKTSTPFYEIVIGDPDIANVNPLTDRSFYVLGNELGTTGIALFDENKQLVGTVDVEVTLDTDRLATTIRDAVPGSNIKVSSANGRVVLSGSAEDAVDADKASRIATRFSGQEEVINSVDIASSQQVQLNVRFVEINRQIGQELGTKLGVSYASGSGSFSFNNKPSSSTNVPATEIIGKLMTGGWTIDLALKALEERGVARRLAEPNLIARSGETANFLAGGEFPIPVSEDDNKISVSYKKYGVGLEFTPTVLKGGLIALDIQPEVSSIDPSSSYSLGNISIPGFVVRRAHTSVDLKSGQSFMIAGLLQSQNDMNLQRMPGLGKLPILGPLFSSKAYQRRETDLVIIITPHLVQPIDPTKKVHTPLDGTVAASNVDYFLGSTEEVKTAGAAQPQAYAAVAGTPKIFPAPTVGHFLELPKE